MVEYGQSNVVSKKKERTPPTTFFGISFGEISYLDYDPNTKLKVQQQDLLKDVLNYKIHYQKIKKLIYHY